MPSNVFRLVLGSVLASSMALSLAGCLSRPAGLATPDGGAVSPDRRTQALSGSSSPLPSIDAPRELFITNLSVVEDPARTTGTGVWTFGTLMTRMANGRDPEAFVRNWLLTWTTDQTVNGDVVKNRKLGIEHVLATWPKLPDGKLDLTKAPFRLAGIVNRIDLRSKGDAGEGRFVFHYVEPDNLVVTGDPSSAGPGDDRTLFTVIFEYGIDLHMVSGDWGKKAIQNQADRLQALSDWANRWHRLGSIPFGPSYNAELQKLTDVFSGANANPTKPNGSALNQLRTNEVQLALQGAFGPGGDPIASPPIWELREFHVSGAGSLALAPVARTTKLALNNTTQLGDLINQNESAILKDSFKVPTSLLAGSALMAANLVWNAPNILHPDDARFKFAQNTCSGCHLAETGLDQPRIGDLPQPFIGFLQVRPRRAGQEAVLSTFLTGVNVTDPVTGKVRSMNDLQRRISDMQAIAGLTNFQLANPNLEAPFPNRVD